MSSVGKGNQNLVVAQSYATWRIGDNEIKKHATAQFDHTFFCNEETTTSPGC
jgi:hypothetical protein